MAKRNWNRVKGYRKKNPRMPVLVRTPTECVVVHRGCKFSFTCNVPLYVPLTWDAVAGERVDDRVRPELPRGFEPMRKLKAPERGVPAQAKKTAMGVLKKERERALQDEKEPRFL